LESGYIRYIDNEEKRPITRPATKDLSGLKMNKGKATTIPIAAKGV